MRPAVFGIAALITGHYLTALLPRETFIFYSKEDGPFENLSALCFFLTSATFLAAYVRDRAGNAWGAFRLRKNVFLLFLAALFFFGAGEEISWGQRMIGFDTPEVVRELNIQQETNIHNLKLFNRVNRSGEEKRGLALLFNFDRLFSVFWASFCILLPVIRRTSPRARAWMDRGGVPDVPLWIGVFFPINYLICKSIEPLVLDDMFVHFGVIEIKECIFAFLFVMVGLNVLSRGGPAARRDP